MDAVPNKNKIHVGFCLKQDADDAEQSRESASVQVGWISPEQ